MVRAWGGALARLHRASETFPVRAALPDCRGEVQAALGTLPAHEGGVVGVLESGLAWLDGQPAEEYGLLHGDLELDNLFWDGARVQVLDFDAAVYGWYAMDIAIALGDVWHEGGDDRDQRLTWFFDGYSAVRPLPTDAAVMLPHLVRLSSALKVAGLLHAYAATDRASSPTWVTAMRSRHERWLSATCAALQSE